MYHRGKDFQQYGRSFPVHPARNKLKKINSLKPFVHVKTHVLDISKQKTHVKTKSKKTCLTEKPAQSAFTIPGLEKIIYSSNHWQNFVWICAVLGFYGLCIYQLVDRVTLYFKAPIVLDVTMKKNTSIEFPSITICPAFGTETMFYKFCQLNGKKIRLKTLDFDKNNLTIEEIWEEFGIKNNSVTTTSSCGEAEFKECNKQYDSTEACSFNLEKKVEHFPTFWGNCLRITPTTPIRYRGAWTFVSYRVNRFVETLLDENCGSLMLAQMENETVFIPHSRYTMPTHELAKLFYRVRKGSEVSVSFQLKQYKVLNTTQHPCVSQEVAENCLHTCLDSSLKETVKCSLPYMGNSSLKPCKSFHEVDNTQEAVETAYKEFDGCNCSRSCDETIISFDSDFQTSDDSSAALSLKYPNNVVEIISERFCYTFSSLLSDIGGNLGFCVGLCLFSFVEIIVSVLQLITKWLRNIWLHGTGR